MLNTHATLFLYQGSQFAGLAKSINFNPWMGANYICSHVKSACNWWKDVCTSNALMHLCKGRAWDQNKWQSKIILTFAWSSAQIGFVFTFCYIYIYIYIIWGIYFWGGLTELRGEETASGSRLPLNSRVKRGGCLLQEITRQDKGGLFSPSSF